MDNGYQADCKRQESPKGIILRYEQFNKIWRATGQVIGSQLKPCSSWQNVTPGVIFQSPLIITPNSVI